MLPFPLFLFLLPLLRTHLHHLLTQQGTTTALDQVQGRVDLISTINSHVQHGVSVKSHEGNAQAFGLLLGPDGGGDGDDVLQLAGLEFLAEALDCGGRERKEDENTVAWVWLSKWSNNKLE